MKSGRLRASLVFVSGMAAFCLFAELFLIPINPTYIVSSASIFFIFTVAQMRLRTQPEGRDQDAGMAAWVLPVMFVLGIVLGAVVMWGAYLWASGSPA